jgi:hypothetical protein
VVLELVAAGTTEATIRRRSGDARQKKTGMAPQRSAAARTGAPEHGGSVGETAPSAQRLRSADTVTFALEM